MDCELCGKEEVDLLVILPVKRPNGCLNTIACEECAIKSGVYCLKHQRPHLGFEDNSTLCVFCLEEETRLRQANLTTYIIQLSEELSDEEFSRLFENAVDSFPFLSAQAGVIRLMVMKQLRAGITFEEVLDQIVKSRLADIILS